ncbi:MAG TPA: DUF4026 domain-containing protein, partial [Planctomycetota bacterium]|nr:DUF4026 domain-containing protein [Planctomycetota bacterium]
AIAQIKRCAGLRIDRVEPAPDREFARDPHWELDVAVRLHEGDEPWSLRVFISPAEPLGDDHLEWEGFTEAERSESLASRWRVGVCGTFGERAAEDFHIVLKLLCALCPQLVAVYDEASYRVHAGAWALDAAQSEVPPSFETLFSVLTVNPESEDEGKLCWLHTHGLARAGCIELEAIEVPEHQVDVIADFIAQVGAHFLESGVPEPDEPFAVGERLELVWLPWETAIQRLPEGHLGTQPDRDETHVGPAGVLFVPAKGVKRRRYISLSSCVPILERNPIYYVSDHEAARTSRLAKEKLAKFVELHRRFGNHEDWTFTVKLGFESTVDDEDAPKHEHLWFEVHEVDGKTVDATLLNQPCFVPTMREGERRRHSLDRLRDFTISTPHGNFSPERLYHLLRLVNENEPASGNNR